MSNIKEISGHVFSRLTAIKKIGAVAKNCGSVIWQCSCSCGGTKDVAATYLIKGLVKSCGCEAKSGHFKKTHGMSNSKEFRTWRGIKKRCISYPTYLKNGIKVCAAWENSFQTFFNDVGICPSDKDSLDRIDNLGNYEPGNCRWATAKEQNNNYSQNKILVFNGISKNVTEWADEIGVKRKTLYQRLRNGFPVEKALTFKAKK